MKYVVCACVFLALSAGLAAQDWPRFRGPNGAGVGTGTGLPVEFGPEKNLDWKVPVMPGHSSPVVAGRRIYLTAANDKALRTFCYDLETGKELWSQSIERERKAQINKLNSPATPTPAADEEGVVVFFQDFGLAAYSKDGKPVWRLPASPMIISHGMGSSPVIVKDTVIQVLGGDINSVVVAAGRTSGKKLWEAKLQGLTYTTPVAATGSVGNPLVVVVSTGEVIAFMPSDGARVWWLSQVPYSPIPSPFASRDGNMIFMTVPGGGGVEGMKPFEDYDRLLKQWDVGGNGSITQAEMKERKGPAGSFTQFDLNGDGEFTRDDHRRMMAMSEIPALMGAAAAAGKGDMTGKLRWTYPRMVPSVATPLVYDGVFYAIRDGGVTASLDAADGKLLKEGRIDSAFGTVYSSPVAADGKIYVANLEGKVAVLKAGRDWEVLAINNLGEGCSATPALVGDRILFRTAEHLWCFRTAKK